MRFTLKLAVLLSIFSTQMAFAEKLNYSEYLNSIKTAQMSGKDLADSEGNPACATNPGYANAHIDGAQSLAENICKSLNKNFILIAYAKNESGFLSDSRKCFYLNENGIQYSEQAQLLTSITCGRR